MIIALVLVRDGALLQKNTNCYCASFSTPNDRAVQSQCSICEELYGGRQDAMKRVNIKSQPDLICDGRFPRYGLVAGEELRIPEGLDLYYCKSKPKRIEVISEHPSFILCMAIYGGNQEKRWFRFCINKADIYCGHVEVIRVATKQMLL